MNWFQSFLDYGKRERLLPEFWVKQLSEQSEQAFNIRNNRDLVHWLNVIQTLPPIRPNFIDLRQDVIQIGRKGEISVEVARQIETSLRELHPWRKGPFSVFGIFIDTEWRSDWKWKRLKDHIRPLKDRLVLDVGSGNGYHCLRMAGEGARLVMGIDPYLKNVAQFLALNKYLKMDNTHVLPLGIEQLPDQLNLFDSVFSMGILYHRRSPFDHLFKLKSMLRSEGELILETLVIEGGKGEVLVPEGRYAKMRNVWFIPSPPTLESWLKRAGFTHIRLIDVSVTTTQEQRSTDWMRFESLPRFLHPQNDQWTIEGYPRPRRAIFICEKP